MGGRRRIIGPMILKSLTVRIGAETTGLQRALAQASGSLRTLADSAQRVGQTMSVTLTAPLVLLGREVLQTAGNFQYAMNRVGALSGATGLMLDRLRDKAKLMGATTAFTATDAANALGFMSMAGMRAADQLEALPRVLQLAASAGLDMATAADIITNVLAGMSMQVDQLGRLNDTLVRTFTRTNTSLTQLGDAMKYVAPVAAAARVEVEAAAAAIGFMGNAGIQGSMAGTSLRGAISRLLAPTDQIREAMQRIGASVKFFDDGAMDLIGTLRTFEPHAQNVNALMTIFGQRAGPGIAAILGQGVDALEAFTLELMLAEGTAERIQGVTMEGFRGSLASLESAVEALGLAIADSGLLEFATDLANDLAVFTRSLATLNPMILQTVAAFAAVVAIVPVVTLAISGLVKLVLFLVPAIAGPVGVLAALLALAAGIAVFSTVADHVNAVERAMRDVAEPTQRITEINTQLATATREAASSLRELRGEQLENMRVMAAAALAELDRLEGRPTAEGASMQRWGAPQGSIREIEAARTRYATLRDQYQAARVASMDVDLAPEREQRYRDAFAAYQRASREAGGFSPDQTRAWLAANPEMARYLRQGGTINRSGNFAEFDPADLLAGDSGMEGPPLPSVVRRNTMEALERTNAMAPQTTEALDRLREIEDEYLASIERGETVQRADIETWVDRRRAIQDEIDARVQWGDAVEETREHIDAQNQLAEAARQGEDQYRRTALALQIMAQNEHLTAQQAYALAEAQDAASQRTQAATDQMQRLNRFASDVGNAFASAFERAIFAGESLGDTLKALVLDLAQMILRLAVLEPMAQNIANLLRGGGSGKSSGGGFWGTILSAVAGIFTGGFGSAGSAAGSGMTSGAASTFSGWFAEGGSVSPGKWGIAGEYGPEPIYGGSTGLTVFPHGSGGGTTVDARAFIDATGADQAAISRLWAELRKRDEALPKQIAGHVGNLQQRGRIRASG